MLIRIFTILYVVFIGGIYCNFSIEPLESSLHKILTEELSFSTVTTDYLLKNNYENQTCILQLQSLLHGLNNTDKWALEVIDSWGKIPSGVLMMNYRHWGHFDECVNVFKDDLPNLVGPFKGQYCLSNVAIKTPLKPIYQPPTTVEDRMILNQKLRMPIAPNTVALEIGICIPNACSPEYFLYLMDLLPIIISDLPVKLADLHNCQQKEDIIFDGMDIFALCFFSLVGVLIICSTMYDCILSHQNRPRNLNFLAFSLYTNGEKLFKCNKSASAEMMDCLNGIRVLSITWVVFAHAYSSFSLAAPIMNLSELIEWSKLYSIQFLISGTVAVDSFFLLSGLLVCWSLLRHLDKMNGKLNIFLLYFHRYLRLTPTLAVAVLFYVTLFRYIGSGPLWDKIGDSNCKTYWWSTLLYVQNYVNVDKLCLGHTWYLSIDMQLFIFSPFLIYPLWRWKTKAVPVLVCVILLSMGCAFSVMMVNKFKVGLGDNGESADRMFKTYYVTHTRMGSYITGVLLGYLLHNLKGHNVKLSKKIALISWIISLGSIFAIIYGPYNINQFNNNTTVLENAFYEVFSRTSWAISISWIIFACIHGYGGPMNWFLSWPQWQPLSRLSYSIYILHLPIQIWRETRSRTSMYFSDANAIHSFWGDFGFTLTLSVLWVLAFESPMITIEKILLGNVPKKAVTKT